MCVYEIYNIFEKNFFVQRRVYKMTYFTVILLIGFSIISFAIDEKEMLERAEEGDKQAILQLLDFYKNNGNNEQAKVFLEKAAEVGDISSLKEIYQQTGRILFVGVNAAARDRIFGLDLGGRMTLLKASRMDYLSSPQRVADESRIREKLINEITQGEQSEGGRGGSSGLGNGGGPRPSLPSQSIGRRLGGFTLGKATLGANELGSGEPVIEEAEDTNNKAALAEYEEIMRPYTEELLKRAENRDVEAMKELYDFYKEIERTEEVELWLNKLKDIANKGHVLALTMVYRATGEILTAGVQTAIGHALYSDVLDTGLRPKMVGMQNTKTIHDSIIRQIKTPVPNRCILAF